MKLSNKQSVPLLILVLFSLSGFLYDDTIKLFPAFIHSWTQSDRYALALGFLHNGFDFFHPATFNLQTIQGITRVDFPINEYIVALIMKIVGTTAPVVFRVYTLCVSILGLVFLFLLTKKITASDIKAWIVTLFVFLSPIYVYYQAGFIPSIPAISMVFIGYYYFFSYKESSNKKQFYLAILFLALAALMRMPFVIFLLAVLLQQVWISIKNKQFKLFEMYSCGTAFLIFFGYYFYNVHLGRIYGNMFLDYLLPAKSFSEFEEIIAEMYHHWGNHYFTLWHYFLLLIVIVFAIVAFIKQRSESNKKYWFHLLIVFCGAVIYFIAMARQYYAHDYYFLDSFFIPVILLLIFSLKTIPIQNLPQKVFWGSSFLVLVILFFVFTQKIQAARYSTGSWDRAEITRKNFIGTDAFLDKKGISKDANILVIDAYTTNAPLILMNRKGYTVLGTSTKNISTSLFWCKWDYVAIQDVYLVSDVIKNYPFITSMIERVGGTGKVSFYKRSEKIQAKTLKQFLSVTPENTLYSANITFDEPITDTLHINGANNRIHDKFVSSPNAALLDSTIEFGTTVNVSAKELKNNSNLKVLVNTSLWSKDDLGKVQLVAAIASPGQTAFYQNFMLKDYVKAADKWQHLEFQFVIPPFTTPRDQLKIYLWNPSKSYVLYDNLEVLIYQ